MANTSIHTAAGIAIASVFCPEIALPLALMSHIPLDLMPMWYPMRSGLDCAERLHLVLQFAMIAVIGMALVFHWSPWLLAGAIVANIPDVIDWLMRKGKRGVRFFWFHGGHWPSFLDPWMIQSIPPLYSSIVDATVIFVMLVGKV